MRRLSAACFLLVPLVGCAPVDAYVADQEALALAKTGRYQEALEHRSRATKLVRSTLGEDNWIYANSLNHQAFLYKRLGRYAEAEPLYEQVLAIREDAGGPDHPDVAKSLSKLAGLYHAQGRYAEAEPLHRRALAIRETALGSDHLDVSKSLNDLASLYDRLGRYREAEAMHKRALTIKETHLGADDPAVATSLSNLAALYRVQGRYGEAEPLNKRALSIREKTLDPNHPRIAASLISLALLYEAQGRYSEVEPLHKRGLAIWEKAYGPDHPDVAAALNNLGLLYESQGRYGEAEPLLKRSLAIKETTLGPDHPDVAGTLNNLAILYKSQGRYGETEALHKRSLAIKETAFGPDHPGIAATLNNLAEFYRDLGRYDEAEPLYQRSREIWERARGPDHPSVGGSFNNLALLYAAQGRYDEAEALHKRSMAIAEKAVGPDHPHVGQSLNNLGELYRIQGRYDEAEPYYRHALTNWRQALGDNHPSVAGAFNNLALVYRGLGRHDKALDHIRRASAIHRSRAVRTGGGRSAGGLSEQRKSRFVFVQHMKTTIGHPTDESAKRLALTAEGFEAGQLANATGAAAAVAGMAARFAAGDDDLAGLVRARQDATERWRKLDELLVGAASRIAAERDAAEESVMRRELAALDERIKGLDARLATAFPQFAELAAPRPVPLAETQALLAEDEALLTYVVWYDRTFVFAVRRDRVLAKEVALGSAELDEAVASLRAGLDPSDVRTLADLPPFDTTIAFALYRRLFRPVESVLVGARHVFAVPDGALQSLPLGVLVTADDEGGFTDFAGYRQAAWLARRYAMTTLPSVSSLRALRTFAKRAKASLPFLGVGDPQLRGAMGAGRGVEVAGLFAARGVADVESVRQLASLPESADELRSLARTLGAGGEALLLGADATETRVKQAPLRDHRLLAFATHGLVAGDLTGLSEPALVLTPPAEGTAADDGLLTASEVARLELDADWVILSACNTAAADGTPGAEGLSGLAKAFFYAGSRALLVSHWPVASDAAVRITTRMLAEAANPGVGRAEAHRRAMLALIDDADRPHYAHPLFWAPFVVVGEGGRAMGSLDPNTPATMAP